MVDRSRYVEVINGEEGGRDPRKIPLADLRDLGGPTSPMKAIRAKCVDCSGGNMAEARRCTAIACALWPFRMARNVFYGTSKPDEDGDPTDEPGVDMSVSAWD